MLAQSRASVIREMVVSALRTALLMLAIAWCAGKEYDGAFCAGVVDFPIKETKPVLLLDATAQGLYDLFPRWVDKKCLTALWKFACMQAFVPEAQDAEKYCFGACMATLDDCDKTLTLMGDQATQYSSLLQSVCLTSTSAGAGCHAGGEVTYSDVPESAEVICPNPLGEAVHRSGTEMEEIDGTACALPCPPLSFTHDEWFTMRAVGKWCSFASCLLSIVVVVCHSEEKNQQVRYLNYGGAIANGLLFLFLIVDDHEKQTCADDVHYYKGAPFCIFQAVVTIGAYIWVFLWEACIALNLWITIVLQLKKQQQDQIRAKFLPVTAICSVLAPMICLAGSNIGYDWAGYTGPVCLFLYSDDDTYYWVLFFTPILIICIASLLLMIHTIVRVNYVLSSGPAASNGGYRRFLRVLKYNRKMLLFVGCYCLLGCYQTGQILYENLDDVSFTSSGEEYVRCLFENTVDNHDPDAGIAACGDHPSERPAIWRTTLLITYASSIGIFSFFVYGTQDKASKQVAETLNSIRSTTGRSERGMTAVREGESSSSKRVQSGSEKVTRSPRNGSSHANPSLNQTKSASRFELESQGDELEGTSV